MLKLGNSVHSLDLSAWVHQSLLVAFNDVNILFPVKMKFCLMGQIVLGLTLTSFSDCPLPSSAQAGRALYHSCSCRRLPPCACALFRSFERNIMYLVVIVQAIRFPGLYDLAERSIPCEFIEDQHPRFHSGWG